MAKKKKETDLQPSIDSQMRLAELLTDSPHLVSLNGSEWQIRALRFGTQHLIAEEVLKIKKSEKTFGDIIELFSKNIDSVLNILTLALLNDREKIFKDGDEHGEKSELYNSTKDTLRWECNVSEFADILYETLQMLDTSFFFQALSIADMLRKATTEKKTKIQTQK